MLEEFYQQGDDMRQRGLTVNPHLDRSGLRGAATGQAKFLEVMCIPLYKVFFQYSQHEPTFEAILNNHDRWEELAERGM